MFKFRPFKAKQSAGVIQKVSKRDLMHIAAPHHYFQWGEEALKRTQLTLARDDVAQEVRGVKRILDLPCGHGRELRYFKAAFPEAQITACDLDRDAVDFCAQTFGATPVYSHVDPQQVSLEGQFDLIWCGSLLTHLNISSWVGFLKLFQAHLAPNGILIFTTHGPHIAELMRKGELELGVPPQAVQSILADYERGGFGYSDYENQSGIGVSLSSPEWVRSCLAEIDGLRLIEYAERGWFAHQDSVACIQSSDS